MMYSVEFLSADGKSVHKHELFATEPDAAKAQAMYIWNEFRQITGAAKMHLYANGVVQPVWSAPNS